MLRCTEITDSVTRGEIAQDLRGGDSSLMTALHPRIQHISTGGAVAGDRPPLWGGRE